MRRVDRGKEPAELPPIRERLTPKWVAFYGQKSRKKPTDSDWLRFSSHLEEAFKGICGYCEDYPRSGVVDHFRPKSKFPNLVYEWENWIFACPSCNQLKRDHWPEGGFVDPCAALADDFPEWHFRFDINSGMIMVRDGLDAARVARAKDTVHLIQLNSFRMLKKRLAHTEVLKRLFEARRSLEEVEELAGYLRGQSFRSLTEAFLANELGILR